MAIPDPDPFAAYRKPLGGRKSQIIYMTQDQFDLLAMYAKREGVNKSGFMVALLAHYQHEHPDAKPTPDEAAAFARRRATEEAKRTEARQQAAHEAVRRHLAALGVASAS